MSRGNDRSRLRLLLASSSVAALLVGGASPAAAACSTGVSANSGFQTCINVTNTSVNGNIVNSSGGVIAAGAASASKTGISVNNGTIEGTIVNHGTINATAAPSGTGIHVFNNAVVTGGITNSGTISASNYGVNVSNVTTFSTSSASSITNSGTLSASGNGINVAAVSTFAGGITNSGTISSSHYGINVSNVGTFGTGIAGGITNSGAISANASGIGIQSSSTFIGGVTNSGTITGSNGIIVIGVSSFAGGVTNSGTIVATQNGIGQGVGIGLIYVQDFTGGITNSGMISAPNSGIGVVATSFFGGITNTGTISAGGWGIAAGFYMSTFAGGISNAGVIFTAGKGIAVGGGTGTGTGVSVSNFSGGIANSGTISANGVGIFVASAPTFAGGISNAGLISAGGNGIFVGRSTAASTAITTFSGGISNSGTISAGGVGIYVADVSTFSGGISNTGTISAATGIVVTNSSPVSIFDSGAIVGTGGTAVNLSGNAGGNTFTLGPGYSISGAVLGSGSDAFQLGGSGNGSFNLSNIGAQYTGFSTFNVTGAATWTVTGTFAPTSPWTVESGTLVITGSLGNASGVTLSGGAIVIGSDNALGAGTLTMDAGTTLSFLNGGSFTVANNITIAGDPNFAPPAGTTQTLSGVIGDGASPGTLAMTGAGTLVLSGANSYSGGTVIDAGTLQMSGAGTLGAATGKTTINSGGTLDLGGTTQTQAAVNLAGGTIQNGGLNAPLNSSGGTINGLGGTASVTATSGTTLVEGVNTYTGATKILGGVFDVVGTITDTASVEVEAGAVLTGTGKVDPATTTIDSGATLVAGAAGVPGTSMTIPGSLSFASGALYVVYLNPTTSSFTTVTGSASLAGTVQANFALGTYGARQYTILTATGGLSGAFASLTADVPNFTGTVSLSQNSNDVFLNVGPGFQILPQATGATVNQRNVVTGIDNAIMTGAAVPAGFSNLSGLGGTAYLNALTQADGENATGAEQSAFQLTTAFLNLMLDPFVDGRGNVGGSGAGGSPGLGFAPDEQKSLPPDVALAYAQVLKAAPKPNFDQRWGAWGTAYGGASNTSGDPGTGSHDTSAQTYGFAAGMDYHFSPYAVAGFALAGGGTNWGLSNGLGSGYSQAFQLGGYGIEWFGPAYVAGAVSFTNHWFTTNRAALGDELRANFIGQSYGARLESGYRYAVLPTLGVTPYGAVQFQDFHTPGYSEADVTGGGFGLSYAAMNATDVRTELGGRFDEPTLLYGKPLVLFGRLGWAHDFVSNPAMSAVFQALPGSSFTVFGAPIPHDSALATAGVQYFLAANWQVIAKFDGEFASSSQTYAGSGTLRYTW